MFTFLNSALAWTLLAASIPLLIHLFTRKKLKRIPFSSIKFLQMMQRERIRQVKIRQILLLLLRTLVLLLLILAFLRPTLKTSDFAVGQKAHTSIVLILDNSMSMGIAPRGQSRFAVARARAAEVVQLMRPGDEISLVTAGAPAQLRTEAPATSAEEVLRALEKVVPLAVETDVQRALELAQETLARSKNLNKEIYLFSDNRATLERRGEPAPAPANQRLFVLDWQDNPARNLYIRDVRVNNQIFEVGKVVEVSVTVGNSGPVDEQGRMVYLLLNGNRVAQSEIAVPAGEERLAVFRIVPETHGYQLLTAEIGNDALALDNRRYALFYIEKQVDVLLAGLVEKDRLFVRIALEQLGAEGGIKVREIGAKQLLRENVQHYDAVILCNIPAIEPSFARKLEQYVRNGGGLLLFLGNDVDLRNYNQEIFERFQLGQLGESLGSLANDKNILRLGRLKSGHPIFRGVFATNDEKAMIESPAFRFAVRVHPDARAETVIEYSNKSPFLLERKVQDGILLAFLSSADAAWSDLTFNGLFAPLVNRAVRYAASKGGTPGKELFAGRPAETHLQMAGLADLKVLLPGGVRQRVRPEVANGRYTVSFAGTGEAGFYKLLAGEKEAYVWAVNFNPKEEKQPRVEPDTFRQLMDGAPVVSLAAEKSIDENVQSYRYGSELWQLFLGLALAGLLVEMLMYRTGKEEAGVQVV